MTAQPSINFARNYDTAYDFYAVKGGIVATDNDIAVRFGEHILDAGLFSTATSGGANPASEAAAAIVAAAGEWTMVGGGMPASGFRGDASTPMRC